MSGKGVHFARMHQQEEEEEEAEQNSWGHEEEEGSEESSSDDEEVNKDSSVFSLLFQQCVKEGESAVDVDHLMGFIQKLQLGHKEGEEVYDSGSASSMTYDLQTLKAMLDCNRDEENKIEEEKYLHIIRAWVEHVRESKNVLQSPQQEVPSVTDSPGSVMQDDPEVSYGSYGHNDSRTSDEASRRSSMRHETEETVAKLQYEIKCLNDRDNSLLRQYDGSEEMLRDFQSRNKVLQTKLDEAMGNLAKLKELEYMNTDLGKMLSDTRSMNEDLLRAKERLNREVEKMKTDFDHLECTLSTTRRERDQFHEQLKVTQTVLSRTKDHMRVTCESHREVRTELKLKLDESISHILLMTNDLEETGSFNAELKATISELESQLHQLHTDQKLKLDAHILVPVTNLQSRSFHSVAAITLSPGMAEVVLFGGTTALPATISTLIAETTVLRFVKDLKKTNAEWVFSNMADKTQLSSSKRIREKMTMLSQLTHDISKLNDAADPAHSTERRVQEAERSRQEAEKKSRDAEKRFQEAERRYEEAERSREEAERGREEAERRSDEAERGREQAERRFQVVERGREEADRSRREAENRVQYLETRLDERYQQDASIEGEKHWLVQRREIHMTNQLLGGGGWGEVKIANFRGVQVASKVLYKDLQSSYYHRAFIREMNMASRVRHPNLVQFIGASMDKEMVILMELMPTSLRQHLTSNAPAIPSAAFRISVSLDVARALNYLHLVQPHPIIHRDISSANVLLEPLPNQNWRAKVTDYGSVNLQNRLKTENPGNPVYSAPEARIPSRQTTKMDVFSFGVLLIEMCIAQFPDDDKQASMIDIIRDRRWVEMIQQCTHQDQTQRPVMSQIITRLTSWQ